MWIGWGGRRERRRGACILARFFQGLCDRPRLSQSCLPLRDAPALASRRFRRYRVLHGPSLRRERFLWPLRFLGEHQNLVRVPTPGTRQEDRALVLLPPP